MIVTAKGILAKGRDGTRLRDHGDVLEVALHTGQSYVMLNQVRPSSIPAAGAPGVPVMYAVSNGVLLVSPVPDRDYIVTITTDVRKPAAFPPAWRLAYEYAREAALQRRASS